MIYVVLLNFTVMMRYNTNISFAKIEGAIADASEGDECSKLSLYVAEMMVILQDLY